MPQSPQEARAYAEACADLLVGVARQAYREALRKPCDATDAMNINDARDYLTSSGRYAGTLSFLEKATGERLADGFRRFVEEEGYEVDPVRVLRERVVFGGGGVREAGEEHPQGRLRRLR